MIVETLPPDMVVRRQHYRRRAEIDQPAGEGPPGHSFLLEMGLRRHCSSGDGSGGDPAPRRGDRGMEPLLPVAAQPDRNDDAGRDPGARRLRPAGADARRRHRPFGRTPDGTGPGGRSSFFLLKDVPIRDPPARMGSCPGSGRLGRHPELGARRSDRIAPDGCDARDLHGGTSGLPAPPTAYPPG